MFFVSLAWWVGVEMPIPCPQLLLLMSRWYWCPRLHALMSAWLLISRLHFTPFVCIFIYMHMFVDFAVLDYFDYGSRDCYFWSFDTFSYLPWANTVCHETEQSLVQIISFRICVSSHRLDIVIAHIAFYMLLTCYPLCCHSWLVQIISFRICVSSHRLLNSRLSCLSSQLRLNKP